MPAVAWNTGQRVLVANGDDVMLAEDDEYTPTSAISHAIFCYNHGRNVDLTGDILTTRRTLPLERRLQVQPPAKADPPTAASRAGLKIEPVNSWPLSCTG